jgi:hypothetical protein
VPLDNGDVVPAGKLYFYLTGTSTPANVYTTPALDVAHSNPVEADSEGVFPPIYLNPSVWQYRVKLTDSSGVQIYQVDTVPSAEPVYARTAAEISAGVTPTDYGYAPGNVRRYGAAGNGTTDDTAAIQTAMDLCLTLTGGELYLPDGTYKITDELLIPFAARWKIRGQSRGGTIIKQYTNNKRILRFTTANTHGWTIESLRLDYSSAQTSAQSGSVAFSFMCDTGTPGAGFYNFTVQDVHIDNAYRCFAHDNSNGAAVWGFNIDRVTMGQNVSGSFFYLGDTSSLGHPNGRFGHIYILADSVEASESIFNLVGCANTTMANIEINNAPNGPRLINAGEGTTIDCQAFKLEVGTYTTSGARLFDFPDSRMHVGLLHFRTVTINPGGTNPVTILGFSSGNGRYDINILELPDTTITSGRLYIAQGASSSGAPVRGARIGYIRPSEIITNIYLTEATSTSGADAVRVDSWAEPRVSNDKGDANYTWAIGDATIIRYDTTLTANRTVTLPSISGSAQNNAFNGLEITIIRTGLGAYTLDIVSSGGSSIVTFASATAGRVTLAWYRFGWAIKSQSA